MPGDREIFTLVRHPLVMRRVRVKSVVELTPNMRRIVLGGDALAGFRSLAPEDHVRLFFPRPGEAEPVLPELTPLGRLAGLIKKPVSRDYTPRAFREQELELDVDFFLHGGGPASNWAAEAKPGDVLGVGGPRGSFVLNASHEFHLFVGDETAHPEFARRIEESTPGTRAMVLALVESPAHHYPFPERAEVETRFLYRRGPSSFDGYPAALEELSLPRDGFAWLAGEASEIRDTLRYLTQSRGFPQTNIRASGHWKRGVVNHDHHEPIATE